MAGLPAAARAVREAAQAGCSEALLVVPGGWSPAAPVRAELARLAGDMRFAIDTETALARLRPGDLAISGERALAYGSLEGASRPGSHGLTADDQAWLCESNGTALLAIAQRRIIKGTIKPQDGIVSRTINRPISQAISALLLRWPGIRPLHGTILSAAAALAMAAALLLGGERGLIWGALLLQLASILDGVDGEIARATFRSTPAGARLDSLVDAFTNLAFMAGVSWNLFVRGNAPAALAGILTMLMMAIGLTLLGRRRNRRSGLNFDALKDQLNARPSRLRTWLIWLTMRDFLAFLAMTAILLGSVGLLLFGFAAVAAGWLVVVLAMMPRQPA